MVGVPGEEVDPSDFDNMVVQTIEFDPPEGANAVAMLFNHGYNISVDNQGAGGGNTRFWLAGPDLGELVVGPRAGAANFGQIRLRHNKISSTAGVALRQDSNGVLYLTSSSRRYKRDIDDHVLDAEALLRIRPVRFKERGMVEDILREMTATPTDADRARAVELAPWCYGAIAEEVHDLGLTELVTYNADPETGEQRPDGLRYEMMGLAALQLIRQQAEQIAELSRRLDAVEGRE